MPPYRICEKCGKYAWHSVTEKIYICFDCGHKIPDITKSYTDTKGLVNENK